jgi:hypothetical protein
MRRGDRPDQADGHGFRRRYRTLQPLAQRRAAPQARFSAIDPCPSLLRYCLAICAR